MQNFEESTTTLHKEETVDIVLMASGFSQRFGSEDKLLQPFCGIPLAQRAIELALSVPKITKIYFVYANNDVGALADKYPLEKIKNQNPQNGSGESVRLGARHSDAAYYMFLPCDMPFMNIETIAKILDAKAFGKIVCPQHGGKPKNPSVFSANFRHQLLSLNAGQQARTVKQNNKNSLINLNFEDPAPFYDIDTKDDFERLEKMFKEQNIQ